MCDWKQCVFCYCWMKCSVCLLDSFDLLCSNSPFPHWFSGWSICFWEWDTKDPNYQLCCYLLLILHLFFVVVQLLSRVWLFAIPWTAAHQASLSLTISQSLLKLMSIESVMPSTISSSVVPFSSHLHSFPAPGSFPMSQLFSSGGQSVEASASASVLPVNIQDWFPLELTGLISLQSVGLSGVFSNTTWCICRVYHVKCKKSQARIKIARRNISKIYLRYAVDTTLMADREEELKNLLMKVKEESEKAGLKISFTKLRSSHPVLSPHGR